ncbi:YppE family protein [Evansella cellulosilytica]|uniref:DUF1798 family protein n=1 Tax=Evansella cellulosilytica (strain ATCC 21833 / DSM 2522 / FERM P-1141 / JCM 9156 / N-4) TaxID=649639 RepID=E6TZK8_EVAC2|nr:YppE family protein [Evansella cellulosilytica]ADU30182.1 Domain of unknown function DUF1798 [Evansella cellulosilytica DSM 2522]
MNSSNERLKIITVKLQKMNKQALKNFEQYALNKTSADFQSEVKPFADEVNELANEWRSLATEFIYQAKPKYIQQTLIDNAHENMQIEAVTCFQGDTKRKRFMERNKSISFLLDGILSTLNEKQY